MTRQDRLPLNLTIALICFAVATGCGKPEPPEVVDVPVEIPLDIPSRYPSAERLIAIGDLHGDLDAARASFRLAGAIDEADHWIGGDLVVVQIGDILDRGDDAMEILGLLDGLAVQARAGGGAIHLLNGNHELMNVKLDMRYVSVGGYLDFLPDGPRDIESATAQDVVDGIGERILAIRPGGGIAMRFAERNVIAIVGDTVFVHGGVLPHIVEYGIGRLNQETRDWISGDRSCPPEPLFGSDGPVWSRHYSDEPDDEDCRLLGLTLERLGARRMVVGHTVQKSGITSACDDRVWRIDVGMAAHYGGGVEVLALSDGDVSVLGQRGDDDTDEYAEYIRALCESDDGRVVDPLIAALRRDVDERTGLWAQIIPALGALRDSKAVPVLIETLEIPDDDWLGREMSARALGRIGDPSAIPALIAAAWRGDTRDDAIAALATIHDARVAPVLVSAIDPGEDQETRAAAMEGLERLGTMAVPALVDALGEYSSEHPETDRRVWICRLLGGSGDPDALETLRAHRNDPDPAVARCAAGFLTK